MHSHFDTIVALATPVGEGGIGIIRLSGPKSEEYLRRFFFPLHANDRFKSHLLYLGRFLSEQAVFIDEVMAVVMRAPKSYTREDVVEIHCHGGQIVLRQVLDVLLQAGARLAKPGEFTLRAFLSGRLDLSQAEAVIDLIRARSDSASRIAAAQVDGSVYRTVLGFQSRFADLLALVESLIDFPEEDIELADSSYLLENATSLRSEIQYILDNFDAGRVLREGLSVLIFGKPNVGKSSLLNTLLGEARAIVTDIPGTTRDTIEEGLVLSGVPLRLIDTAGVRDTDNPIEAEGVSRARAKIASADLVLFVVGSSCDIDDEDMFAFEACRNANVLVVRSKCDLPQVSLDPRLASFPHVAVSTRSGVGIEKLKQLIVQRVCGDVFGGDVSSCTVFSDRRHREALLRCNSSLSNFLLSLKRQESPEFSALDLRDALTALGEITGETTPDHILDRIFSKFCIGK